MNKEIIAFGNSEIKKCKLLHREKSNLARRCRY